MSPGAAPVLCQRVWVVWFTLTSPGGYGQIRLLPLAPCGSGRTLSHPSHQTGFGTDLMEGWQSLVGPNDPSVQ